MTKETSSIFLRIHPYIIGGILFLLTIVGWLFYLRGQQSYDEARFNNVKNQIEQEITSRMETYINTLVQTKSMFHVTKEVDRKEFKDYVFNLNLIQNYPGIQGIGFTQRLGPKEVPLLEQKMRGAGISDFKVWPNFQRPEYFSIIYLEPLDWRNKRAIGYDMFTNATRQAAMEKARDTGLPAMSGTVELVQETDEDKQIGFLIYVPVYKTDALTETVEQRRKNLIGFVYSPFRARDLFLQIMRPLEKLPVSLKILVDPGQGDQFLFDRYKDQEKVLAKELQSTSNVDLAQTRWKIDIQALEEFKELNNQLQPYIVLVLGLLISFLVTYTLLKNAKNSELLEERSFYLEKLNESAKVLSAQLDIQDLLQSLTDIGRELSGAQFGAFFYNSITAEGEAYLLYTVSGVPRAEFDKFPMPRLTEVFAPTFLGQGTVISQDITKDSRYGKNKPHGGMPPGHLPVKSYLAVSVVSRTGEVIGALFYGHKKENVFGEREKELIEGLAPQAAIAIDNARLYQEAQRAIAARDEFVSIASHELKTPITSMQLQFQVASRMLEKEDDRVFEHAAVARRINTATKQLGKMTKLIDDMLDSSRISMNKFEMNKRPFNLARLLTEILDRFEEQLTIEGIQLNFSIKETELMILGDEYRMEQVISNMITNAIKYGNRRPITVDLTRLESEVALSVKDEGIGIKKEQLPHIFKRYERAISSANISGLGLGLYISKSIVEAHGGSINVESELEKETVFTVHLPLLLEK